MSNATYERLLYLLTRYGDLRAAAASNPYVESKYYLDTKRCIEDFKCTLKPFIKEFV